LSGDDGNDRLFAGAGTDVASCGSGTDDATVDSTDRATNCEALFHF
jgi:hypothetical protein